MTNLRVLKIDFQHLMMMRNLVSLLTCANITDNVVFCIRNGRYHHTGNKVQVLPTQSGSPHSSTTSASDYSASQQAPPSTASAPACTCIVHGLDDTLIV